ncbi:MAG: TonB-dependent receptor [Caulobacter sp.]|nr:TonB-dependent receptor [Caulobacter sp.]
MFSKVKWLAAASVLAMAASAVPAWADDAPKDDGATVGEVVITGMRRESTVQNTAAAISVVSAEKLDRAGVNGPMTLQYQTPGVLISQDLGLQTQVYIRGVGSNLQGIAVSNSVATYVDGVYIPNVIQAAQGFNDIERVEVLKGPQATLYGRNATGGAISVVSADPSLNFSGKADASVGNYKAYSVRVGVTGPLVGDKVAGRISFQAQGHEGYTDNLFLGTKLDGNQMVAVRGALKFFPTDNVDLVLRADYTSQHTSDILKLRPSTSVYYAGNPGYYTADPRAVYYDLNNAEPMKDRGASLTVHANLGIGKLTSVTSFRKFNVGPIVLDSDQVPVPGTYFPNGVGAIGSLVESASYYHETYLATDASKPFSAIIGVNFFREDATENKRQLGPNLANHLLYSDRFGRTDAWSVYGDFGWSITDQLKLVGGVRYSQEKKRYQIVQIAGPIASGLNGAEYSSTSPRIGLEWRPQAGLLVYATATSGFKSGGFNTDVVTNSFSPEKIWSYEAGVKAKLFDGRARVSLAGFYYDYKNIQVLQYLTIGGLISPIVTNGGTAKLWGLDFDGDLAVTDHLKVGMGASWEHTEFGSAIFCDPLQGSCTATNPADRPMFNVEGNRLPRAPELTANIYGDYTVPVSLPGKLTVHADAAYRSRTYFTVFENPIYASDPFWIANATVRYEGDNGWFVEAYGQNLTDELAVTQIINSSPLRSPGTGVILYGTAARFERYAAPRTYGLRVGVKF